MSTEEWAVEMDDGICNITKDNGRWVVANVYAEDQGHLIAVAPQMFAKLKELHGHLDYILDRGNGNDFTRQHYREIGELIAKAEALPNPSQDGDA